MNSKALREKRASVAAAIQDIRNKLKADSREDFSAEEQASWDKMVADYDALTKRIAIAEKSEQIEAQQKELVLDAGIGAEQITGRLPVGGDGASVEVSDEMRALAFQAWATGGKRMTTRHIEACNLLRVKPQESELAMGLYSTSDIRRIQHIIRSNHPTNARAQLDAFKATLSNVTGSTGGFIVPPETLIRELELNMLWFGGMRQVADQMRTATGERMSWPTADDTGNKAVLLGANASIGSSVDPSFTKVYWDAYKFSSQPILVPYELLQDNAVNLVAVIGQMLGERLGRGTNTYYTTGTGAAQPKGIVTAATTGVTTAANNAITSDNVIDLYHSVDKAYRQDFGWMMADSILQAVRKLKDQNNQYLWVPSVVQGLQPGIPDLLFGSPYAINNDMSGIVASATVMLGGTLSHYKIRTVGETRFYRLQERYRDTDQDGFIALIREDGNLLTAGQAPLKALVMHS